MKRNARIGWVLILVLAGAMSLPASAQYGGGTGTADDPYLIYTAEQLAALGTHWEHWDAHFLLMADIDLSGYQGSEFPTIGRAYIDAFYGFNGVFDGNGKVVSDFTYTREDSYAYGVGLFEKVGPDGCIENLRMVDPNVAAVNCGNVGAVVGQSQGMIVNCHVENASVIGRGGVGGLVGIVVHARGVYGCSASGLVVGENAVGGLVGNGRGPIEDCWTDVEVVGESMVGGLVGDNYEGPIERCCSSGTVTGDSWAGGLAGASSHIISNCYSICEVQGYERVGGLIGIASPTSLTTRCYAAGQVTGVEDVGGLIGYCSGNLKEAVRRSFWDIQASGWGTSGGGIGLSSALMQTPMFFISAGWDFVGETNNGVDDYWQLPRGRCYPRFAWEPTWHEISEPWVDEFEDGLVDTFWQVYTPSGNWTDVQEANGVLMIRPTEVASTARAWCVPKNWMLDTTEDFAFSIDFQFGSFTAGERWVSLGVTPDANEPWAQYVDVTAGCLEGEAVYAVRLRTENGWWNQWDGRARQTGTLYVSYNAEKDELYRSYTGYGPEEAWQTTTGLIKDTWAGKPLCIAIGGGGQTEAGPGDGNTWLDNFILDSGLVTW